MADELNKVMIEIVLDDGSVQKGFVRVQKEAEKTAKKVSSDFQTIGDSFETIAPRAASAFRQVSSFFTSSLGIITGAVLATGATIKAAFDLTKLGEQTLQVQRQFQAFASQSGNNATELESAFTKAIGGVEDLEDVLKASGVAITELGANASKLPQIFEIARKSSLSFGGDTLSNYNSLISAITSGQTKQLKSIGLFVDSEAALASYALSLGKTTAELTLQERQQAVLNATLEKASTTFKNVSLDQQNLETSTKSFTVALGDYFEAIGISLAKSGVGELFANISKSITKSLNESSQSIENYALRFDKLSAAEGRIDELKKKLESLSQIDRSQLTVSDQLLVTNLNNELSLLQATREELLRKESAAAASGAAEQTRAAAEADVLAAKLARFETEKKALEQLRLAQDQYEAKLAQTANAINQTYRGAIVQSISSGIQMIGASLVKGKDAFASFGDTIKNIIGDMAINIGTTLLGIGLGIEALKTGFATLTGGAAIAAGAALIAIGGALKASAGSQLTSAATSGGGLAATSSPVSGLPDQNQLEPQQAGTQISVVVQGDVFDSDETGMRLVDIISNNFDKTGAVIRQGAFA